MLSPTARTLVSSGRLGSARSQDRRRGACRPRSRSSTSSPAWTFLSDGTSATISCPSDWAWMSSSWPRYSTTSILRRDPHRAAPLLSVQLEILRPEADHQVTAAILLGRLRGAAGEMERRPAERQVPFAGLGGREVHRRRADERRDENVDRVVVELGRRADLLEHAVAHHGDPVAHRHRLDLVVRDVDRRRLRAGAAVAGSRRASARAASRRGSRAARPSGTPPARARSRVRAQRAGADHPRVRAACDRAGSRG